MLGLSIFYRTESAMETKEGRLETVQEKQTPAGQNIILNEKDHHRTRHSGSVLRAQEKLKA